MNTLSHIFGGVGSKFNPPWCKCPLTHTRKAVTLVTMCQQTMITLSSENRDMLYHST